MSARTDLNVSTIVYVGVVGALVTVVLILSLQALYLRAVNTEAEAKVYSQDPDKWQQLLDRQQTELDSYRWIDEKSGIVGVPIDYAIELTLRDLRAERSESGG